MRATDFLTESFNLPMKSFKQLFHVGSMDASQKRSGSYEGAGLSVSTEPDAWRKIARGYVTGDTYSATKPNNKFIDANRISKKQAQQIFAWAEQNELVMPATTYRVSYFDDELDSEVYSDYDSLEAAQQEAGDPEDIKAIKGGYVPTNKLKQAANNQHITPTGILDYVLPIYAESIGVDGVWWNDILDVHKYSAPRGVILPSQVKTWKFEKIAQ
jgi:hypothetical protein